MLLAVLLGLLALVPLRMYLMRFIHSDFLALALSVHDDSFYYLLPAWHFSTHGYFSSTVFTLLTASSRSTCCSSPPCPRAFRLSKRCFEPGYVSTLPCTPPPGSQSAWPSMRRCPT